jgi:CPA2 family monovalent cation:H+ antiporter-2
MVTLQLAVVLLVSLLLLALTQPFLPRLPAAISLLVVLLALGIAFARSTSDLQGHVTAGAGMVVEALVGQARKGERTLEEQLPAPLQQALSALGEPTPVRIEETSVARGKTLAELDLRGLTGATVLAIIRGDQHVLVPGAHDRLQLGDVLALAGTHEAVSAATRLLAPPAIAAAES